MKISNFDLLSAFFLLFAFFQPAQPQCCLTTVANSKKCASCPEGTHLYRGNCLFDIEKCVKYSNGFECLECDKGFTAKG